MIMNKKKLFKSVLFAMTCYLYYQLIVNFNIGIPCVFHKLTGLLCPGCGITHMYIALSHFEFAEAFQYNPFIFATQPIIYYFLLKWFILWLQDKLFRQNHLEKVIMYIWSFVLVIFTIFRNF